MFLNVAHEIQVAFCNSANKKIPRLGTCSSFRNMEKHPTEVTTFFVEALMAKGTSTSREVR